MSAMPKEKPEELRRLEQMLSEWGRERQRLNEIGWRGKTNVLYLLSSEAAEYGRKVRCGHCGGKITRNKSVDRCRECGRKVKIPDKPSANLIHGTGEKPEPDIRPSATFELIEPIVHQMPLERPRKVGYIEYNPEYSRRPLTYRAAKAELNRHLYRMALDQFHAYLLGRVNLE